MFNKQSGDKGCGPNRGVRRTRGHGEEGVNQNMPVPIHWGGTTRSVDKIKAEG